MLIAYALRASDQLMQLPSSMLLISLDPPDHTKMRMLVNRGFTPRRIRALEANNIDPIFHIFGLLLGFVSLVLVTIALTQAW